MRFSTEMHCWGSGAWRNVPNPLTGEEGSVPEGLQAAGYESEFGVGSNDSGYDWSIRAYSRDNGTDDRPQWVLVVTTGDTWQVFGADTVVDALDLTASWAPIVTADVASTAVWEALRKGIL